MIRFARFLTHPLMSPADIVLYVVMMRLGIEGDWRSALVYYVGIITLTVALKRIAAWKDGAP